MKSSKKAYIEAIRASNPFDAEWYLKTYPDVKALGMDPLEHYLWLGVRLNRPPSPTMDTNDCSSRLRTVADQRINPLANYLKPHEDKANELTKANVLLVGHLAGDTFFGAENSLIGLASSIDKRKYNIHLALPRANKKYIELFQPHCASISVFKYGWINKNAQYDTEIKQFQELIRERSIQLVHVNSAVLVAPLIAARQEGVVGISHVREIFQVDPALCLSLGMRPDEIIRTIQNYADEIIVNSRATRVYNGFSEQACLVYNEVDIEGLAIPNSIRSDAIYVGMVSSNTTKKGVNEFFRIASMATARLPMVKFRLIGPATEFVTQCSSIPNNVELVPYKETPKEAISLVNIILNLSTFMESFGRSVAEGMAAGRPVITYDWGALPELVRNNVDGFVVPFMDCAEVLERIERLARTPENIDTMGRSARTRAIELFSRDRMRRDLDTVYSRALTAIPKGLDSQKQVSPPPRLPHARSSLRIGYFIWHFPVPSETFVLNELRQLVDDGHDVTVFCRHSPHKNFAPDFPITWKQVNSPDDLARSLVATGREVVHSHFVYPTVTDFLWPACEAAKVPFTFIGHSQDIFRHDNEQHNRLAEISRSEMCLSVLAPSRFHRDYFIQQGVSANKIIINPNGVDPRRYPSPPSSNRCSSKKLCAIHRFVEKKGLENLIRAAKYVRQEGVTIDIFGYGPLEDSYRQLIKAEKATNVQLLGPLNSFSDVVATLSTYDALLCPSIRANDGDMDGLPTVLLDAMAAGTPVLATPISGIPELVVDEVTGFICDASPEGIAASIKRFYATPTGKMDSIRNAARHLVQNNYDVRQLTRNLVRIWRRETIDIIVVSWDNLPELQEVIRRIQHYTTYPYKLIVWDNASQTPTRDYLRGLARTCSNVEVILHDANIMVGPGTNSALQRGSSEFAIYVCGKEGFILNFNWELPFIQCLTENPLVALAGTLGYSPSYLFGKDFASGSRFFPSFRNRDFAERNPDREFRHVQGGLFAMRRSAVEQLGGFSSLVKHDGTDVELSFYAESEGWKLGQVRNTVSLYAKTRPFLEARVDESTRSVHPARLEDLPRLDEIVARRHHLCTLCGWEGGEFTRSHASAICPNCGSHGDDRSLWRYLAESTLTYRRAPALGVGLSPTLERTWRTQFRGRTLQYSSLAAELDSSGRLSDCDNRLLLVYADALLSSMEPKIRALALAEFHRIIEPEKGRLILHCDVSFLKDELELGSGGEARLVCKGGDVAFRVIDQRRFSSYACQFGWQPITVLEKIINA